MENANAVPSVPMSNAWQGDHKAENGGGACQSKGVPCEIWVGLEPGQEGLGAVEDGN